MTKLESRVMFREGTVEVAEGTVVKFGTGQKVVRGLGQDWAWLKVDQGFFPTDTLFSVDAERGGERVGLHSYAEATRKHKLST